jgi:hypothetical protein
VIAKISKGRNVTRLLYYLYGPGKSDEHADPHLIAGCRGDLLRLEPPLRPDGKRDFGRLSGLLDTPLKIAGRRGRPGTVWHCVLAAAPADPLLSDQQWQAIADEFMDVMGLAGRDSSGGVRWVAVRHGLSRGGIDHVHIAATLALPDGTIPSLHNDFLRARRACRRIEEKYGLTVTAPADRTAAARPSRAETERSARMGRSEPPRVTLRRMVQDAAAAAVSEQDFFARLGDTGALIRYRYSDRNPGEVTGYAVALPGNATKTGQPIWYGGAKLAPDLTLPKLRHRWASTATSTAMSAASARAFLRSAACSAAEHARNEQEYFAALAAAGIGIRYRHGERAGEIAGYAVTLPGSAGSPRAPAWFGGGQLDQALTLPRLRQRWTAPPGAIRSPVTSAERQAIWADVTAAASAAAARMRDQAGTDPAGAADTAWATADLLRATARAVRGPAAATLRRAARDFDRAAREARVVVPQPSPQGSAVRTAARFLAVAAAAQGPVSSQIRLLVSVLADLADATASLREAQLRAHQAAAARRAAELMYRLNQRLGAGPVHLEHVAASPGQPPDAGLRVRRSSASRDGKTKRQKS